MPNKSIISAIHLEIVPYHDPIVIVNDSLTLTCNPQGISGIVLTWMRFNQTNRGIITRKASKVQLKFSQITSEDAGEYECFGNNTGKKIWTVANITVLSKFTFRIKQNATLKLNEGDTLKLNCKAIYPNTAQVRWIPPFQIEHTNQWNRIAKFRKDKVQSSDSGLYICQCRYKRIIRRKTITLLVQPNRK